MKIVVLAGGISTERDVSLSSGKKIYQALVEKKHQAVLLDVYLGYEEEIGSIFELEKDWGKSIEDVKENNPDISEIIKMRAHPETGFFGPNVLNICQMADLVFLALHGENGENGKIQATFDLFGIRYTGTDYVSSALSMDKELTKELFSYHKIPHPQGTIVKKGEETKAPIPFPIVVKVCCGGSSVGVYMAENQDEYEDALKKAFQFEDKVIVEEYIKGREFSVGVIAGKALPIIEIAPLHGFYDYKNKYQAGSTIETSPAQINDALTAKMQKIAEDVFRALRLKTYARMDFMLKGEDDPRCLEANTLPGMTPTSLLPQEAAAMGVDFPGLCEWIIKVSLEKYDGSSVE